MNVNPTMRVNGYVRPTSAPPTYRYSNFFKSFTDLNLAPDLTFTASTSTCSTPISEEFSKSRSSLESATSYTFSVRTFAHFGNGGGLERSFPTLTSTMKGRTLSLRGPLFRRVRTTTANSANSSPTTISTAASTFSGRSKRLLAKVPKIFEFELPFGALKIHRISKVPTVSHGLLTKRHRKPSTLDFRCIGMAAEDDFYFGGTSTNICAPRIHWVKPDIHSDWKKDWFTGVC